MAISGAVESWSEQPRVAPALVIVHGGQTGVERGAHRAALSEGLAVSGIMTSDGRDELGPVPFEVANHLTRGQDRTWSGTLRANIAGATGMLLVVPDRDHARAITGMAPLFLWARAFATALFVCDPVCDLDAVRDWSDQLAAATGAKRILVTGPRATRWGQGESVGRRVVKMLALE